MIPPGTKEPLNKFIKLNGNSELYKAQLKIAAITNIKPNSWGGTTARTTSNSKAWPGNPGPTPESEASTGSSGISFFRPVQTTPPGQETNSAYFMSSSTQNTRARSPTQGETDDERAKRYILVSNLPRDRKSVV